MTTRECDLLVIGGGPAGMAAANAGAALGLKTLLMDEQMQAGGQIYRNINGVSGHLGALLGPDYLHGRELAARLRGSAVETHFGTLVWEVTADREVSAQKNGQSFRLRAKQIIAASGAMERASPVPGWTLPGVMNAGAAQIALKSGASLPAGRVVLAGGGPLLFLVACQLMDAGAEITAIVETSPAANLLRALPHLPTALTAPAYLIKGLSMMRKIRVAGIPWFRQASALSIDGRQQVEAVRFHSRGQDQRIAADVVLLHHGIIPNTQIGRMLRIEHAWNQGQLCWHPILDSWGETSSPGIRIAGDGGGIAGALAAEASGMIAAYGAAYTLGKITEPERDRGTAMMRRLLDRHRRIRPFLDALYQPPEWLLQPSDDVVVCRCEEVTAGRIRKMASQGCTGPNQTKFFSRCGMGPCQGRICGLPVTQILARELRRDPGEVGAYRIRPPLKPIPIGSLAALDSTTTTGDDYGN
ncbi:NAD(P)/FAD-dependent oxidoreductase [Ferrovibrio sp.]|uniref:FAD/NAD(P)-dependent oxidoreductase n=1 Tax=Ferrovibrio sp. TaxID=1917215 RepID=UPI0026224FFB|nr:NAD(P)/FAD-dependent oxidoreductase [Ferrovibrio sp.]